MIKREIRPKLDVKWAWNLASNYSGLLSHLVWGPPPTQCWTDYALEMGYYWFHTLSNGVKSCARDLIKKR